MKAEIFESIYDGYINGLSYSELSSRLKLSPGYVSVFTDVNVGLNRTGVALSALKDFILKISALPHIKVLGLHCYDGHDCDGDVKIRQHRIDRIAEKVFAVTADTEKDPAFGRKLDIVAGGTPEFPCWMRHGVFCSPGTAFVQDSGYFNAFRDMDGIKPGAAVLTRVISNPTADSFTLDCGYKAIASDPKGLRGCVVGLSDKIEECFRNEEHWVFKMKTGFEDELPKVGDILYVIPTHICPTSALYPEVAVAGDGKIKEYRTVAARNRRLSV